MSPQLTIIDSIEDIVAYDCETTGLTKRDQIIGFSICAEADKAFYIRLADWNKESNSLLFKNSSPFHSCARQFLQFLTTKSLIMHNGIFDCMMAEAYFKTSLIQSLHTDTMVLAHLLDENRRVGLKELAKQYFGEDATIEARETITHL